MARDGHRQGAEDRPPAADLHGWPRPRLRGYRRPLSGWKLTVRRGPKVVKSRHADLTDAVRAVEAALADVPEVEPRSAFRRDYGPGEQVVSRAELRGSGRVRGGVDLHGDGTARAWTGGITKVTVTPGPGESPYAALARTLGG